MTMKKTTTNSPTQMPEDEKQRQNSSLYTRARPKRKQRARLTIRDAEDMAQLAAMRLTESESCAKLDIPVSTWRAWRARHNNEDIFTQIFERIKGERIAAHLQNIEKFSEKDWRASECYLEKTQPSRFASRALAFPQENVTFNVHNDNRVLLLAVEAIYGKEALPAHKQPKALPEPTPEAANMSAADFVKKLKPAGNPKP